MIFVITVFFRYMPNSLFGTWFSFNVSVQNWNLHKKSIHWVFDYLIPIKIFAPLNFASFIFAPLIFEHPQISCPFDFRAPLFYCKIAFFHSCMAFFLLPLIFAHSYCANLLPLIFAQARCAKIKGARILIGIR